jgi:hypothetical protein
MRAMAICTKPLARRTLPRVWESGKKIYWDPAAGRIVDQAAAGG